VNFGRRDPRRRFDPAPRGVVGPTCAAALCCWAARERGVARTWRSRPTRCTGRSGGVLTEESPSCRPRPTALQGRRRPARAELLPHPTAGDGHLPWLQHYGPYQYPESLSRDGGSTPHATSCRLRRRAERAQLVFVGGLRRGSRTCRPRRTRRGLQLGGPDECTNMRSSAHPRLTGQDGRRSSTHPTARA